MIHENVLEFGGTRGFQYEGSIYFVAEKAKLKRTLEEAAATYLYGIIIMHPFIDANKRTAYLSADTFLRANGYFLEVDLEEGKQFTLNIAKGDVDFFEVVRWIKAHMKPIV